METLNIPVGNTLPQQIQTLQAIKDAMCMALFTNPAIAEKLGTDATAMQQHKLYLEADLKLKQIDAGQIDNPFLGDNPKAIAALFPPAINHVCAFMHKDNILFIGKMHDGENIHAFFSSKCYKFTDIEFYQPLYDTEGKAIFFTF